MSKEKADKILQKHLNQITYFFSEQDYDMVYSSILKAMQEYASQYAEQQGGELLKRLDRLGAMLYEKCGTDSYEVRCYLHDTKEMLKQSIKPQADKDSENEIKIQTYYYDNKQRELVESDKGALCYFFDVDKVISELQTQIKQRDERIKELEGLFENSIDDYTDEEQPLSEPLWSLIKQTLNKD